ncbi:hypothetical protein EOM60_05255 [Candidatus Saccharibacteria bacterium]|nr:hypothetical protein [Candidatus Saccharibacteria bacterium]
MTSNKIFSHLKPLLKNRQLLGLIVANLVVAVLVIILIGLSIRPSETQVITRFSSFGTTGFYWGYWWTLLTYILLEIIIVISILFIASRLIKLNRAGLAPVVLWLSLIMSFILFMIAYSVTRIAALG